MRNPKRVRGKRHALQKVCAGTGHIQDDKIDTTEQEREERRVVKWPFEVDEEDIEKVEKVVSTIVRFRRGFLQRADLDDMVQELLLRLTMKLSKKGLTFKTCDKKLLYRMVRLTMYDILRMWTNRGKGIYNHAVDVNRWLSGMECVHEERHEESVDMPKAHHPIRHKMGADFIDDIVTEDLKQHMLYMIQTQANTVGRKYACRIYELLTEDYAAREIANDIGISESYVSFIRHNVVRPEIQAAYNSIANR